MISDTSRAAYATVPLQQREREVMTACWRHFPTTRFTRKELARALGWEINRVTGRVLTLIERGYLTEHDETRDGGHLLSIAELSTTPRRMADERSNPESRMQPAGQSLTSTERAAADETKANRATMPGVAAVVDAFRRIFPDCKVVYASENGRTLGSPSPQGVPFTPPGAVAKLKQRRAA